MTTTAAHSATDALAGIARRHAGDPAAATAAAQAVLQAGCEHPELLRMVVQGLAVERKAAPGIADTGEVLRRYGGQLARRGLLTEARAALEVALVIDPDIGSTRSDAGTAAFIQGDLATARTHHEAARTLDPQSPAPIAALAAIAARQGRAHDARTLGLEALALAPGLVTAELAIARADLALAQAPACIARLTAVLARTDLVAQNRVAALDLRADAHDAAGDAAVAFADYAARNALIERANAARIATEVPERRVAQAERLNRWFAAADAAPWRARADADSLRPVAGHCFLLSFPRSGTTLLEKALAGHPDIVTMEEVDHLAAVGGKWLANDTALHHLTALPAADAAATRAMYWARTRATLGDAIDGRILVDKLPLHTVALPVIARLFPDATILFAVRDPRDVVLSCFRRRFAVNAAMFEFLTLAGAARYYSAVMALADRYRALLPLTFVDVRHETLVNNFDGELTTVLAAMGAGWDPAVRAFASRIGDRFRTPSDVQLTRGLSDAGIGQWRRYADQLEPVASVVAPWVQRFGYPA